MKWTNMVVVLALIVLVGWLGNGVISCASGYMAENKTDFTHFTITVSENNESWEAWVK